MIGKYQDWGIPLQLLSVHFTPMQCILLHCKSPKWPIIKFDDQLDNNQLEDVKIVNINTNPK